MTTHLGQLGDDPAHDDGDEDEVALRHHARDALLPEHGDHARDREIVHDEDEGEPVCPDVPDCQRRQHHEAARVAEQVDGGENQVPDHDLEAAEVVAEHEDEGGGADDAHDDEGVDQRLA